MNTTATPLAASPLPISAVMIVDQLYPTLVNTLESLADFAEVIVYGNGNDEGVEDFCRKYANVKYVKGEFIGFGPTRNVATRYAKYDWIFSIDSDESISAPLKTELHKLDFNETRRVYKVNRHNFFIGKHIKRAGWGNDWLIRLYNRRRSSFTDDEVHEQVKPSHDVVVRKLKGPLFHQAVTDVDQFLRKISHYSELRREAGAHNLSPGWIVLRAGWAFFRSYFLKRGMLEGWRGLVIAWSNANGVFYKYIKIYADSRLRESVTMTLQRSRIPAPSSSAKSKR